MPALDAHPRFARPYAGRVGMLDGEAEYHRSVDEAQALLKAAAAGVAVESPPRLRPSLRLAPRLQRLREKRDAEVVAAPPPPPIPAEVTRRFYSSSKKAVQARHRAVLRRDQPLPKPSEAASVTRLGRKSRKDTRVQGSPRDYLELYATIAAASGADILEFLRIHGASETVYARSLEKKYGERAPKREDGAGKVTDEYRTWLSREYAERLHELTQRLYARGVSSQDVLQVVRRARSAQAARHFQDGGNNMMAYFRGVAIGAATGIGGAALAMAMPPAAPAILIGAGIAGAAGSFAANMMYSRYAVPANGTVSTTGVRARMAALHGIPESFRKIAPPRSGVGAYFNELGAHLPYLLMAGTNLPRLGYVVDTTTPFKPFFSASSSAAAASTLAVGGPIMLAGPAFGWFQNGAMRVLSEEFNGIQNGSWSPLFGLSIDEKEGIKLSADRFDNVQAYFATPVGKRTRHYMSTYWRQHIRWNNKLVRAIKADTKAAKKTPAGIRREGLFGNGGIAGLFGALVSTIGRGSDYYSTAFADSQWGEGLGAFSTLIGRTALFFTNPLTRGALDSHYRTTEVSDKTIARPRLDLGKLVLSANNAAYVAVRKFLKGRTPGASFGPDDNPDVIACKAFIDCVYKDEHSRHIHDQVFECMANAVESNPRLNTASKAQVLDYIQAKVIAHASPESQAEEQKKVEKKIQQDVPKGITDAIEVALWVDDHLKKGTPHKRLHLPSADRPNVRDCVINHALHYAQKKRKKGLSALESATVAAVLETLSGPLRHLSADEYSPLALKEDIAKLVNAHPRFADKPAAEKEKFIAVIVDAANKLPRAQVLPKEEVARLLDPGIRYTAMDSKRLSRRHCARTRTVMPSLAADGAAASSKAPVVCVAWAEITKARTATAASEKKSPASTVSAASSPASSVVASTVGAPSTAASSVVAASSGPGSRFSDRLSVRRAAATALTAAAAPQPAAPAAAASAAEKTPLLAEAKRAPVAPPPPPSARRPAFSRPFMRERCGVPDSPVPSFAPMSVACC